MQEFKHGGSIFSVKVLPNGDFVTACTDMVARVFTRDRARVASAEVLQNYEEMSRLADSAGGMTQLDESKFPGEEALQKPGIPLFGL